MTSDVDDVTAEVLNDFIKAKTLEQIQDAILEEAQDGEKYICDAFLVLMKEIPHILITYNPNRRTQKSKYLKEYCMPILQALEDLAIGKGFNFPTFV